MVPSSSEPWNTLTWKWIYFSVPWTVDEETLFLKYTAGQQMRAMDNIFVLGTNVGNRCISKGTRFFRYRYPLIGTRSSLGQLKLVTFRFLFRF